MEGIAQGNAADQGSGRNGWFLGHFLGPGEPLRSDQVELKWTKHPQGETNGKFTANRTASTIMVLVRGAFRFTFLKDGAVQEARLEKEGDYAFWGPGIAHRWDVEEDCLVLTVRWPSAPDDQYDVEAPPSL